MYKSRQTGNNDISQKIRKYLSSPKEAPKSAETAFLGASAMFKGFKTGILGCCQVLPHPCFAKGAQKASVFYQGFRLFVILHNVCFMVCIASISGTFYMNFSLSALIELVFFFSIGNKFNVAINSFENIMQT